MQLVWNIIYAFEFPHPYQYKLVNFFKLSYFYFILFSLLLKPSKVFFICGNWFGYRFFHNPSSFRQRRLKFLNNNFSFGVTSS
uniref:Uncharacterized protein n=1 Tax=Ciona intestinalis TaxID=7719 RepID=H2Y2Q9_CIOIN